MQYKQSHSPHPHLLYIVKKAGHTLGRPTEMRCVRHAVSINGCAHILYCDRVQVGTAKLGFLAQSLGLEWKDTERGCILI
jgi:hypothetical protein